MTNRYRRHAAAVALCLGFVGAAALLAPADARPDRHPSSHEAWLHRSDVIPAPALRDPRPLYALAAPPANTRVAQAAPAPAVADAVPTTPTHAPETPAEVADPTTVAQAAAVSTPAATSDAGWQDHVRGAYEAITLRQWWVLAGFILALIGSLVTWLLNKKWSVFRKDAVRYGTVLALAGLGGVSHAWIAYGTPEYIGATTFFGALKVFAMAVAVYMAKKKVIDA